MKSYEFQPADAFSGAKAMNRLSSTDDILLHLQNEADQTYREFVRITHLVNATHDPLPNPNQKQKGAIKIEGSSPFLRDVLLAVQTLVRTETGRKLIKQLIQMVQTENLTLNILEPTSSHPNSSAIGQCVYLKRNKQNYFLFKNDKGKEYITQLPFFVTVAHELIHVLQGRSNVGSKNSHAPTIGYHYHNRCEQQCITGNGGFKLKNFFPINENQIEAEHGLLERRTHQGLAAIPSHFSKDDASSIHFFGSLIASNSVQLTQICLEMGFNINQLIYSAYYKNHFSCAELAAAFNSVDTLKLLIRLNADITKNKSSGKNLLHIATEKSAPAVTDYLLESKTFDINAQDNQGHTALHHAIQSLDKTKNRHACQWQPVKNLLAHGADPNILTEAGESAFYLALDNGKNSIDIFLNTPIAVNINAGDNGHYPILKALKNNNTALVDQLINRDANVDVCDSQKISTLHFAAQYRKIKYLYQWLDRVKNPLAADATGRTFLHVLLAGMEGVYITPSKEWQSSEIHILPAFIRWMHMKGYDVNPLDKNGLTPLDLIKHDSNREQLVQALTKIGMNTSENNYEPEAIHYFVF